MGYVLGESGWVERVRGALLGTKREAAREVWAGLDMYRQYVHAMP